MTIHRNRDGIDFECDDCTDGLETKTHNFADARIVLAQADWKTRKVPGKTGDEQWQHVCPGCQG